MFHLTCQPAVHLPFLMQQNCKLFHNTKRVIQIEELKEVFKRIGIGQKDDFGQPYEEWFITDYDCYVDGLYSKLSEYENLDELNYLASKLDEMSESCLLYTSGGNLIYGNDTEDPQ